MSEHIELIAEVRISYAPQLGVRILYQTEQDLLPKAPQPLSLAQLQPLLPVAQAELIPGVRYEIGLKGDQVEFKFVFKTPLSIELGDNPETSSLSQPESFRSYDDLEISEGASLPPSPNKEVKGSGLITDREAFFDSSPEVDLASRNEMLQIQETEDDLNFTPEKPGLKMKVEAVLVDDAMISSAEQIEEAASEGEDSLEGLSDRSHRTSNEASEREQGDLDFFESKPPPIEDKAVAKAVLQTGKFEEHYEDLSDDEASGYEAHRPVMVATGTLKTEAVKTSGPQEDGPFKIRASYEEGSEGEESVDEVESHAKEDFEAVKGKFKVQSKLSGEYEADSLEESVDGKSIGRHNKAAASYQDEVGDSEEEAAYSDVEESKESGEDEDREVEEASLKGANIGTKEVKGASIDVKAASKTTTGAKKSDEEDEFEDEEIGASLTDEVSTEQVKGSQKPVKTHPKEGKEATQKTNQAKKSVDEFEGEDFEASLSDEEPSDEVKKSSKKPTKETKKASKGATRLNRADEFQEDFEVDLEASPPKKAKQKKDASDEDAASSADYNEDSQEAKDFSSSNEDYDDDAEGTEVKQLKTKSKKTPSVTEIDKSSYDSEADSTQLKPAGLSSRQSHSISRSSAVKEVMNDLVSKEPSDVDFGTQKHQVRALTAAESTSSMQMMDDSSDDETEPRTPMKLSPELAEENRGIESEDGQSTRKTPGKLALKPDPSILRDLERLVAKPQVAHLERRLKIPDSQHKPPASTTSKSSPKAKKPRFILKSQAPKVLSAPLNPLPPLKTKSRAIPTTAVTSTQPAHRTASGLDSSFVKENSIQSYSNASAMRSKSSHFNPRQAWRVRSKL
jgi:hypothetical protein